MAYDTVYVALAKLLGATLITRDTRMAGVPDLGVRVALSMRQAAPSSALPVISLNIAKPLS